MQLTLFSDYALRALIYIGAKEAPASLSEIASAYGISRNHLIKAVNVLEKNGFVATKRGVGGGIKLARDASMINLGEVVQCTEPGFLIVECFDETSNTCPISPACKLKSVLAKATKAFLNELTEYSLADLLGRKAMILKLLDTNRIL